MADISGRIVMVTGADGGLGYGLATAFARAGADVVGIIHSSPSDTIDGVRYKVADLTDDAGVGKLFEGIGAPWAVVNTVGGFAPHRALADLDLEELATQQTLNLTTAAILTKHALRVMTGVGQGRIIHTASQAGVVTKGAGFAYSVSKAGVLHLVRMAAEEVAKTGIRVNAVSPSIIDTPANRAAMPKADHASWPKVEDIAEAYLFLASPGASLVNGATLPV